METVEAVATVWDMAAGAAVVLSGVVGSYWQLKGRADKEALERKSDVKALGKDVAANAKDIDALRKTQEKLVRREYRREGAAMARSEDSDVSDMPRRRVHVGTDTTLT